MERVQSKDTISVVEEEETSTLTVETEEIDDVDILIHHGISLDDVKELKNIGINTLKGLEMITTKELLSVKGLNAEKICKIQTICAQYNNMEDPFVTASKFYEQRKQLYKISTGSNNLK